MSSKKIKILFISHDATRTGAPILLLQLVRQMRLISDDQLEICTLFKKDGVLVDEFRKLGQVVVLEQKNSFTKRVLKRLGVHKTKKIPASIKNAHFDIVFSNTITNGQLLEELKLDRSKVISYIHELEYSIRELDLRNEVEGTFSHTGFFLCGSQLVQENLINNHSVNPEKTEVVYSFSDLNQFNFDPEVRKEVRKELNIEDSTKVIGMVGSLAWRKGPDLFVEIAEKFDKSDYCFVWIGFSNNKDYRQISYEQELKGLTPKVVWIPPSEEYAKYYQAMDLFFLSSREDPYPLVCVEASAIGLPILCFENTTGFQEFISKQTGRVIPFKELDAASHTIVEMLKNSSNFDRKQISDLSKQTHDVKKQATKIYDLIKEMISSNE